MKTKINVIEIILTFICDLTKTFTYLFLAIYVISVLFDVVLDPSFPLQGEGLLIGAVLSAVVSMSIRLWLLRHK